MTDNELQKVLNAIKYIPSEDERNAYFKENGTNGFIKFKKQEINSMPDYLKKLFTINDKIVTYRHVNGLYQARFRRDGYNIEIASKSFDITRKEKR